jgi:hypothetical protein
MVKILEPLENVGSATILGNNVKLLFLWTRNFVQRCCDEYFDHTGTLLSMARQIQRDNHFLVEFEPAETAFVACMLDPSDKLGD